MLLDCIFRSGIETSWQIKKNKSLEREHAKIVALLKAFDLYVEERQQVLDKDYNVIYDEYAFNISDFLRGNFIKHRSKKDVAILLQELADDKIIRSEYQKQMEDEHSFLKKVFRHLVDYRMVLQQGLHTLTYQHITETRILCRSQSVMEQQAEMIDRALLKIIGYKKPVPEKVLIRKYNFPKPKTKTSPDTGLISSNKSLEEILAAL